MLDEQRAGETIPLPELNECGDLPVAVYEVTLSELLSRFGTGSPLRRLVGIRLERIHRLAAATGQVARFIVFGSFITGKIEPNDVDVFLLMDNEFDVETVPGESAMLFDHPTAQAHFGASIFWIRQVACLGGVQATIEDWQVKRDGSRRGIVHVTGD
ncbi:MAG: hypothetical protein HY815_07685 [Candidatus Riflebacteria bacterium]|nr:hypothetical protein [Candidatus Riflebacteria bacterium]